MRFVPQEMIFHRQVVLELRVGKASALCLVDMEGLWWAARLEGNKALVDT